MINILLLEFLGVDLILEGRDIVWIDSLLIFELILPVLLREPLLGCRGAQAPIVDLLWDLCRFTHGCVVAALVVEMIGFDSFHYALLILVPL